MQTRRIRTRVVFLLFLAFSLPAPQTTQADPIIPAVWDIVVEDFESGSLNKWSQSSPEDLTIVSGIGINGSSGLAVAIDEDSSYLYKTDVARAAEGYMTFWFNPNGVQIPDTGTSWVPGKSLRIASIVNSDDWWPPLVSLYVRRPSGEGYQAYLAWPIDGQDNRFFDYEEGSVDLVDGWQKITVGYRVNEWAAVWLNDQLERFSTNVVHTDPYGDIIQFGKISSTSNLPSGTMLFDNYSFQIPRLGDLWVDDATGDDSDDGLTPATAFRSLQKAADLAGPGTTVHIMPGVYRETVWPALSGSPSEAALYLAEAGPGTVVIRGSEPSGSLSWTQLQTNAIGLPAGVDPTNIYFTDILSWGLDGPPRFVAELAGTNRASESASTVNRLPLAREPDWQVATEWKHHEFWWAADGGATVAACDPASNADPNCDYPSRSMTQLTDRSSDVDPPGVEFGNLSTLGNLTGATLVAIDTLQGHYVYRRTITSHDVGAGRVTVDRICEHDSGSNNPGLGWGSKYYVEGKPNLLDTPGEWWYDEGSGLFYLWPPSPGNPATMDIEVSRRENGFNLRNRSYITLDGLDIELVNGSAIYLANWSTHKAYQDTVRNAFLRYANWGVFLEQSVRAYESADNRIDGFTLESSEISHMDSLAIRLIDWWENGADPDLFSRSGVVNTMIRDNEFHHLGFRTDGDNAVGASFHFASKLRIEDNYIHHVAHNGFQISRSVIQSPKEYDFDPSEIKTGEILVRGNVFEKACQLTTDCGGLKFWGSPPDNHVFRDVLVTENVFRDSFGWTHVSEKRRRWMGGPDSQVRGKGAFGLYVDHASGIHAFRNISYNNAYTGYMIYGVWRDGAMIYYNNLAANSLYGMSLGGSQYDTHGSVNAQFVNNMLVNNEAYGISHSDGDGLYDNMTIGHNLYFQNGWRTYENGGMWKPGAMILYDGSSYNYFQTLPEIQANTPWETLGVQGDPAFWDYNPDDHDLVDGSWPDFYLTNVSVNAIDLGTQMLPDSLMILLDAFDVDDFKWGSAYDIGRHEAGFGVFAVPNVWAIEPGGTATYTLGLYPENVPHSVTVSVSNPSPSFTVTLSPTVIAANVSTTLSVVDNHSGNGVPGLWFTIPYTSTGASFTHLGSVGLLVGGRHIYLPFMPRR